MTVHSKIDLDMNHGIVIKKLAIYHKDFINKKECASLDEKLDLIYYYLDSEMETSLSCDGNVEKGKFTRSDLESIEFVGLCMTMQGLAHSISSSSLARKGKLNKNNTLQHVNLSNSTLIFVPLEEDKCVAALEVSRQNLKAGDKKSRVKCKRSTFTTVGSDNKYIYNLIRNIHALFQLIFGGGLLSRVNHSVRGYAKTGEDGQAKKVRSDDIGTKIATVESELRKVKIELESLTQKTTNVITQGFSGTSDTEMDYLNYERRERELFERYIKFQQEMDNLLRTSPWISLRRDLHSHYVSLLQPFLSYYSLNKSCMKKKIYASWSSQLKLLLQVYCSKQYDFSTKMDSRNTMLSYEQIMKEVVEKFQKYGLIDIGAFHNGELVRTNQTCTSLDNDAHYLSLGKETLLLYKYFIFMNSLEQANPNIHLQMNNSFADGSKQKSRMMEGYHQQSHTEKAAYTSNHHWLWNINNFGHCIEIPNDFKESKSSISNSSFIPLFVVNVLERFRNCSVHETDGVPDENPKKEVLALIFQYKHMDFILYFDETLLSSETYGALSKFSFSARNSNLSPLPSNNNKHEATSHSSVSKLHWIFMAMDNEFSNFILNMYSEVCSVISSYIEEEGEKHFGLTSQTHLPKLLEPLSQRTKKCDIINSMLIDHANHRLHIPDDAKREFFLGWYPTYQLDYNTKTAIQTNSTYEIVDVLNDIFSKQSRDRDDIKQSKLRKCFLKRREICTFLSNQWIYACSITHQDLFVVMNTPTNTIPLANALKTVNCARKEFRNKSQTSCDF